MRDHPRSRGVYLTAFYAYIGFGGSSPLARGLPWGEYESRSGGGIIPARAGFTVHGRFLSGGVPDHPRSRGVYPRTPPRPIPTHGSSPLARGLRSQEMRVEDNAGIIPARAGFTTPRRREHPISPDHPRSRGVYLAASGRSAHGDGSSPLARGLPPRIPCFGYPKRIIPARAGFTGNVWKVIGDEGDHPRSRGVYLSIFDFVTWVTGSSPLARGLLWDAAADAQRRRIIPARAGFTRVGLSLGWSVGDHPRSRGVYCNTDPP